ncbi:glycosyltransferase family 2 protein [Shewanella holmiensis]|uniref:Glycosyltransferase n=1 Tax=Shewanella holmiensis TaxID=2952222 RepID=A0A9X2WP10_9GAMM|nr:glycosyltransferase family 2 protein [Shewanella holmiensis]MCT7942951.1 glycosyltransferase [Shewanella holmiensis]
MTDLAEVNLSYSTTRNLTSDQPVIQNSVDDKFQRFIFLPLGKHRSAEGGLRTKGYFKKSLPNKPLVTIVTVVFNGAQFLEETIKSVIEQTYDNVEYIIIDGGSTDDSQDIIRRYEHAIDYWVSEKDSGMYDAINKGLCTSQGDVINFINSDDFFCTKHIIEKVVKAFRTESCDCLYGGSPYVDGDGKNVFLKRPLDFKPRYFKTLGMPFTQPTFFWTYEVMKDVGLLDLKFRIASDYDFIARLCLRANKVLRLEVNIASFRIHGNSFGDQNTEAAHKEFSEINKSLPVNAPTVLFYIDRIKQKINQMLSKEYV